MYTYSIGEWLLFFYIYCFLGWGFESTYVSVRKGHWVNRGFMRAPFLPLYGSGAILMLVVGRIFQDNVFLTYLVGLIAATLLEFFTGLSMEWFYKIKYWDYSNQRCNFMGHICLTSSIAWGFFTLLMTRVLHGPIEALVFRVPAAVITVLVSALTIFLAWDFILSFKAAMELKKMLIQMEKDVDNMELREEIADMCESIQAVLTARYEVRISSLHLPNVKG